MDGDTVFKIAGPLMIIVFGFYIWLRVLPRAVAGYREVATYLEESGILFNPGDPKYRETEEGAEMIVVPVRLHFRRRGLKLDTFAVKCSTGILLFHPAEKSDRLLTREDKHIKKIELIGSPGEFATFRSRVKIS